MPGENSGNNYSVKQSTTPVVVDAETQRENKRLAVQQAVTRAAELAQQNTVTTSSGNILLANSANVREDRVDYTPNVKPNPTTSSPDWSSYRAGERGDSISTTTPPPPPPPPAVIPPTVVKSAVISSANLVVAPFPPTPTPATSPTPTTTKIKSATPEIILFGNNSIPMEIMADLIFEDIGGQELISVGRHDLINGDNIQNSLIKNLSSINQLTSSQKILSLHNTADKYFANFGIKLENKTPLIGNGQNGSNVYFDSTIDSLVLEFINIEQDEQVEVQFQVDGTIYSTVYYGEE